MLLAFISAKKSDIVDCIFYFTFQRMFPRWGFKMDTLTFLFGSVWRLVGSGTCWRRASMMFFSVCSKHYCLLGTVGILTFKTTTTKIYCLLILSLQHSVLFNVQIKDCAQSSLLIKCNLKSTWLSSYSRYWKTLQPPDLGLAYTTMCTINQNNLDYWSSAYF